MGLCINLLGFPIAEDAACAAKRRAQRNQLNRDNEAGRTARNASDNRRKGDVAASTGSRSGEAILEDFFAIVPGLTEIGLAAGTGGLSTIPDLLGGALGGLGGLFGGGQSAGGAAPAPSTAADYLPYVLGAGAVLVVVLVVTSDDGKRR